MSKTKRPKSQVRCSVWDTTKAVLYSVDNLMYNDLAKVKLRKRKKKDRVKSVRIKGKRFPSKANLITKELLLRKIVFADTSEIWYLSRCQILLQYIITCSRQSLSRELCKMVSKTTRKGLSPYPFLSIFSVKFSIPCTYYLNSWNNITAKKSWLIKTNNSRRLWFRISWFRKRFVGFNILLYHR